MQPKRNQVRRVARMLAYALLLVLILVHSEVSSFCPYVSRCSPLQQAVPLAFFCGSISSGMVFFPSFRHAFFQLRFAMS